MKLRLVKNLAAFVVATTSTAFVPGAYARAILSDVFTQYDASGAVLGSPLIINEGDFEDGNAVYPVAGIATLVGHYTVWLDPDGSFSDVFGVANLNAANPGFPPIYVPFFTIVSDDGGGIDLKLIQSVFGFGDVAIHQDGQSVAEPSDAFDVSQYIDFVRGFNVGGSATFQSDVEEAPSLREPNSIVLIGMALLSLLGLALTRRRADA